MATNNSNGTSSDGTGSAQSHNWNDLANHLQVKVQKRNSEVSHLHTRAGFLIAASVIVIQVTVSLPKFNLLAEIIYQWAAAVLGLAALTMAIISMHISKSTAPLNPDEMIQELTKRPNLSRQGFGKWLAESYAKANKKFNEEYNKKYDQQVAAAILLVTALAIAIILKGFYTYV